MKPYLLNELGLRNKKQCVLLERLYGVTVLAIVFENDNV